ncbi:MAG: hypothetical protein KF901_14090 [Myxococcales bacterium]|nr:hypothetical protein [Myxococcales bacterium]
MPHDRALEAFRRLLADAAVGGQAKVDALVALSQRTVFVPTWSVGGDDFRTLVSSEKQHALPVFTDHAALRDAAGRFGWLTVSGDVPHKEIGARQAFRHLFANEIGFLIVDIGSEHALECERPEIEPLLATRARSDSSGGPFAAVGRVSETMLQAVRPSSSSVRRPSSSGTPRPDATPVVAPPPVLSRETIEPRPPSGSAGRPSAPARPPSATFSRPSVEPPAGLTVSTGPDAKPAATFGSGGPTTISALPTEPSDEVYDAISNVLRGFPEVEWASLCHAARGPVAPVPTVGLRVDSSYRARVGEIVQAVRVAADAAGASVDVLLLDDPALVRAARGEGVVFFPWRRRG